VPNIIIQNTKIHIIHKPITRRGRRSERS